MIWSFHYVHTYHDDFVGGLRFIYSYNIAAKGRIALHIIQGLVAGHPNNKETKSNLMWECLYKMLRTTLKKYQNGGEEEEEEEQRDTLSYMLTHQQFYSRIKASPL